MVRNFLLHFIDGSPKLTITFLETHAEHPFQDHNIALRTYEKTSSK